MSFLAPWFLVGGLAVAGPLLFHLIRRSARERVPFSTLLFLRPAPPRETRRLRLEDLLLLILRCAAIVLLAGAFARPFLSGQIPPPPPAASGRQILVLLDTSASMRRPGLWVRATALAQARFALATIADRVALMVFDRQLRSVFTVAEWTAWPPDRREALARERLAQLAPGWAGTQLGPALTGAAEQFSDAVPGGSAPGAVELVLISDLQEGASLEGLQGHEWPKGLRVVLEPVTPTTPGNAAVQILPADPAVASRTNSARLRVVNTSDSKEERFHLGWLAADGGSLPRATNEAYVAPGRSRVFPLPPLPAGVAAGGLRLTGDAADFDNTAWFAAPEAERLTVAYLGSDSLRDPAFMGHYLARAFPATARREVAIVPALTNGAVSTQVLAQAAFAVIPGLLAPDAARVMADWVAGGKAALFVMTNAAAAATLGALLGTPVEAAEDAAAFSLLGEIDFTHPLFAPFAEPKFSDFSRIHFWKHRVLTLPAGLKARVLARFDDRSPALTEFPVGKGRLLCWSAGWHPVDSQLAVASKFVPLLQTMLEWSGAGAPSPTQFQMGDPLPVPGVGAATVAWRRPDGKVVSLAGDAPFLETELPGIYTATVGSVVRRYAVNLPPEESRTPPLSADDLGKLGVPIQAPSPVAVVPVVTGRPSAREEWENTQKLWRWFLAGVIILGLAEIGLAYRRTLRVGAGGAVV